VDLSPAQLACLRLRVAAYRSFPTPNCWPDRRGPTDAAGLLTAPPDASPEDQAFWAARKTACASTALGGVGKFRVPTSACSAPGFCPSCTVEPPCTALLEPRSAPDRQTFYERRWHSLRWRWLLRSFFLARHGPLWPRPQLLRPVQGSVAGPCRPHAPGAGRAGPQPQSLPRLDGLTGRHGPRFRLRFARIVRPQPRPAPTAGAPARARWKVWRRTASGRTPSTCRTIFEYMSPSAHAEAYGVAARRSSSRCADRPIGT
jgi:S-adenosylmethionine-diacylglycerol 3-amino-3-carboxypropyl transferase